MTLFSGPEETSRRMNICLSCEKFKHNIKICGICKCFMPFKTKVQKARCPLQKW